MIEKLHSSHGAITRIALPHLTYPSVIKLLRPEACPTECTSKILIFTSRLLHFCSDEGSYRLETLALLSLDVEMPALDWDEVIRKRLLIDGDGAGDDRRINLLLKSFIKWCNSGSQEEGYSQHQRMLGTLGQCEFSMGKTLLVYDMNLREMLNYEKISKDIESNIAAAHDKISECKKQILQAKRIRKNRQEYDALAKVIQQHPDRHETLQQLEALGKELEHLSHIKENVEDKLELRRKQFHVLLSTIHELQQTLESDEKLSEGEDSPETRMEMQNGH
ncbi:THO complex subunit 7 homolog isoform X1 [Mustelus asterias]